MATGVSITITNFGGNTFNLVPPTFTADVTIGAQSFPGTIFGKLDGTTAVASINPGGGFPAGPATLSIQNINQTNWSVLIPPLIANAVFTFNSTPQTVSPPLPLVYNSDEGEVESTTPGTVVIACLHGSSLITMRDGLKRIDKLKAGEEVLSGKNLNEYVKIKSIVYCPLYFQGVDHDALIFEPNSLNENEPSTRLIIDPGHPMCTQKAYLEKGHNSLRPAGTFLEEFGPSDKIFTKKWTDVFVQEDKSIRYDLLLEEPYNTYVANGVVVQARGYDHRYKNFV